MSDPTRPSDSLDATSAPWVCRAIAGYRWTLILDLAWRLAVACLLIAAAREMLRWLPIVSVFAGLAAALLFVPAREVYHRMSWLGPAFLFGGIAFGMVTWFASNVHVATFDGPNGSRAHIHSQSVPWWAWSGASRMKEWYLRFDPPIDTTKPGNFVDDEIHPIFWMWRKTFGTPHDDSCRLYSEGQAVDEWEEPERVVWKADQIEAHSGRGSVIRFQVR